MESGPLIEPAFPEITRLGYRRAMPPRRFPKPWSVEPMLSGYRVIDDANGVVLAQVHGQPDGQSLPPTANSPMTRRAGYPS